MSHDQAKNKTHKTQGLGNQKKNANVDAHFLRRGMENQVPVHLIFIPLISPSQHYLIFSAISFDYKIISPGQRTVAQRPSKIFVRLNPFLFLERGVCWWRPLR